jgi:hypothetical protein
MIYCANFDEAAKKLVVATDFVIAWYDMAAGLWDNQALPGEWRGSTKHLGVYVAVGKNKIAAGPLGSMAVVATVAGDWKDVETSGGKAVAVADGRTAASDDGVTGWTAQDGLPGYGDAIAYNSTEGLFWSVGRAGALSSADGLAWVIDEAMPPGTWRDIQRGHECMFAFSGRTAYRTDMGDWVLGDPMPGGGWEAGANGSGYNLAVGNGIAAISAERAHSYVVKDIPNFVYTCAVYGAGRFWALGSAVVAAVVTDIAAALGAIEGANEDNRIATIHDLTVQAEYTATAASDALDAAKMEIDANIHNTARAFALDAQADAEATAAAALAAARGELETAIAEVQTAAAGEITGAVSGINTAVVALNTALAALNTALESLGARVTAIETAIADGDVIFDGGGAEG